MRQITTEDVKKWAAELNRQSRGRGVKIIPNFTEGNFLFDKIMNEFVKENKIKLNNATRNSHNHF